MSPQTLTRANPKNHSQSVQRSSLPAQKTDTPVSQEPTETFTKSNPLYPQSVIPEPVNRGWKGRLVNAGMMAGMVAAHLVAGAALGPAGLVIVPTAITGYVLAKGSQAGAFKNYSLKDKAVLGVGAVALTAVTTGLMTGVAAPAFFAAHIAGLGTASTSIAVASGAAVGALSPERPGKLPPKTG